MSEPSTEPSSGRVVRTLQDGFWDLTEVLELADGSHRVRKRSKGATAGPWAVESLRREIHYLRTASPVAAEVLPRLLAWWDRGSGADAEVGYEMPFYPDHRDAGALARSGALGQEEIDIFQGELAEAVFSRLHTDTGRDAEPLAQHMDRAVRQAFAGLAGDAAFAALIDAPAIELNGRPALGPRAAFEKIGRETDLLARIDRTPPVRLHGDLFLENILWRPLAVAGEEPRLVLIDVVSVAGVSFGPPLWDLVKYESYATGELKALRSERIDVAGFGDGTGQYRYRVRAEDPVVAPFRANNWHALFREAYVSQHGRLDERMYRFIHGYFNAAMALNTTGLQRQGRLLRATEDFNAVLAS